MLRSSKTGGSLTAYFGDFDTSSVFLGHAKTTNGSILDTGESELVPGGVLPIQFHYHTSSP